VVADLGLQRFLFRIVYNLHSHLASKALGTAFQDAHDRRLILPARAGNLFGPLVLVNVPRLAADESLIRFNLPG
jgi:hypothetical protein